MTKDEEWVSTWQAKIDSIGVVAYNQPNIVKPEVFNRVWQSVQGTLPPELLAMNFALYAVLNLMDSILHQKEQTVLSNSDNVVPFRKAV